jgi:hypothetical protein
MNMSNNNQPNGNRPQVTLPQTREPRDANARELETRAADLRPETWAPPSILPEVIQQPGYEYRWVRTATQGVDDAMNINSTYREGFSPVSVEEQPHMVISADPGSRYKGSVEIGGLLLCKAPVEFMRKREEYYNNIARGAQQAVDQNLMKEQDSRMPIHMERKTKVTFGGGGT